MSLSEMFWSFVVTSIATCFLATLGFCLKSKCDKVEMCCLSIHRNVAMETDIETPKNRNADLQAPEKHEFRK
jgi:hypothetical protein